MKVSRAEDLLLYSKTVCPKCMLVERKLQQKNILYKKINIEKDESKRQYLIDLGLMSLPIVEINGRIISDLSDIMESLDRFDILY